MRCVLSLNQCYNVFQKDTSEGRRIKRHAVRDVDVLGASRRAELHRHQAMPKATKLNLVI
jgi:hypothetical protein